MNTTPQLKQEEDELATPRDIAKVLKCSPQSVNSWHRKGIIPARIAVGRIVRFDRREVIEALKSRSKRHTEAAASTRGEG